MERRGVVRAARRRASPARRARSGRGSASAAHANARQQPVERQQDVAGEFVAAEQGGVGREALADRDRLVHRPRAQVGRGLHRHFGREVVAGPEPAFGEHVAGLQRAEDRLGVFLNVAAELLARVAGRAAEVEAVAHAVGRDAHEELRVGPLVRLRLAVERDPLHRLVRPGAAEVVLADARDRAAGARVALQIPAVLAVQHRADVPLRDRLAQLHQRLAQHELVALAVVGHPVLRVRLRRVPRGTRSVSVQKPPKPLAVRFRLRCLGDREHHVRQFQRVNAEPLAQHGRDLAPQPRAVGVGQRERVRVVEAGRAASQRESGNASRNAANAASYSPAFAVVWNCRDRARSLGGRRADSRLRAGRANAPRARPARCRRRSPPTRTPSGAAARGNSRPVIRDTRSRKSSISAASGPGRVRGRRRTPRHTASNRDARVGGDFAQQPEPQQARVRAPGTTAARDRGQRSWRAPTRTPGPAPRRSTPRPASRTATTGRAAGRHRETGG